MRDRYRSEGTRRVLPRPRRRTTGSDGYDMVEWIAAQPWSNGRIGTVAARSPGSVQMRTALERPPHLTAIWPDVVPTNSFQHQSREGGAMQLHMFWALFIHAQDAQDIADDPEKQADVWDDLRDLRELFRATPCREGQTSLRGTCRRWRRCCSTTPPAAAYDECWARKEYDYTALLGPARRHPGDVSTGWFDRSPHADTEYFAAMAAQNTTPQRLVIGPWSHVGDARRRDLLPDVDFGPDSVWGVERYFEEQLATSSTAGCRTTRPGSPRARRRSGSS